MNECRLLGCARSRHYKASQLCQFHHYRQEHGIPLDLPMRPTPEPNRTCSECGDKHYAKGFCTLHYWRYRRGIPLNAPKHSQHGRAAYFDWAACGTPAQARKHYRLKVPMCGPCRKAERRYQQDLRERAA